jgi:hypothetical protein
VTLIGTTPTFALGALVILAFFATKPPLSSSFTLLEQMGCGLLPMASAVDLACLVRGCCIAAVYKTPHPGAPAKACSYRRRHVRSGRVACRLDDLGAETGLFPGRSDPVAAAAGGLATMRRGGNAIRMARLEIPFDAPLDHARADPPDSSACVHAFMPHSTCIVVKVLAIVVLLLFIPRAPSALHVTAEEWRL